jgi:hypothetical protein
MTNRKRSNGKKSRNVSKKRRNASELNSQNSPNSSNKKSLDKVKPKRTGKSPAPSITKAVRLKGNCILTRSDPESYKKSELILIALNCGIDEEELENKTLLEIYELVQKRQKGNESSEQNKWNIPDERELKVKLSPKVCSKTPKKKLVELAERNGIKGGGMVKEELCHKLSSRRNKFSITKQCPSSYSRQELIDIAKKYGINIWRENGESKTIIELCEDINEELISIQKQEDFKNQEKIEERLEKKDKEQAKTLQQEKEEFERKREKEEMTKELKEMKGKIANLTKVVTDLNKYEERIEREKETEETEDLESEDSFFKDEDDFEEEKKDEKKDNVWTNYVKNLMKPDSIEESVPVSEGKSFSSQEKDLLSEKKEDTRSLADRVKDFTKGIFFKKDSPPPSPPPSFKPVPQTGPPPIPLAPPLPGSFNKAPPAPPLPGSTSLPKQWLPVSADFGKQYEKEKEYENKTFLEEPQKKSEEDEEKIQLVNKIFSNVNNISLFMRDLQETFFYCLNDKTWISCIDRTPYEKNMGLYEIYNIAYQKINEFRIKIGVIDETGKKVITNQVDPIKDFENISQPLQDFGRLYTKLIDDKGLIKKVYIWDIVLDEKCPRIMGLRLFKLFVDWYGFIQKNKEKIDKKVAEKFIELSNGVDKLFLQPSEDSYDYYTFYISQNSLNPDEPFYTTLVRALKPSASVFFYRFVYYNTSKAYHNTVYNLPIASDIAITYNTIIGNLRPKVDLKITNFKKFLKYDLRNEKDEKDVSFFIYKGEKLNYPASWINLEAMNNLFKISNVFSRIKDKKSIEDFFYVKNQSFIEYLLNNITEIFKNLDEFYKNRFPKESHNYTLFQDIMSTRNKSPLKLLYDQDPVNLDRDFFKNISSKNLENIIQELKGNKIYSEIEEAFNKYKGSDNVGNEIRNSAQKSLRSYTVPNANASVYPKNIGISDILRESEEEVPDDIQILTINKNNIQLLGDDIDDGKRCMKKTTKIIYYFTDQEIIEKQIFINEQTKKLMEAANNMYNLDQLSRNFIIKKREAQQLYDNSKSVKHAIDHKDNTKIKEMFDKNTFYSGNLDERQKELEKSFNERFGNRIKTQEAYTNKDLLRYIELQREINNILTSLSSDEGYVLLSADEVNKHKYFVFEDYYIQLVKDQTIKLKREDICKNPDIFIFYYFLCMLVLYYNLILELNIYMLREYRWNTDRFNFNRQEVENRIISTIIYKIKNPRKVKVVHEVVNILLNTNQNNIPLLNKIINLKQYTGSNYEQLEQFINSMPFLGMFQIYDDIFSAENVWNKDDFQMEYEE